MIRQAPIVILGATSAIAQAYARRRAAMGAGFVLVGRRDDRLATIAADLMARGAESAEATAVDIAAFDAIERAVQTMRSRCGEPGEIVVAYGMLGDQTAPEQDLAGAREIIDVNFTSAALWILAFLKDRDVSKPLTVLAIGSVAGDRGRAGNFLYGAAKGGLDIFVQGLAHKYADSRVKLIMIKPGFVDTPMTAAFVKSGPLWSSPDRIARDMQRAVARGSRIVYTPWFWRPIMAAIRHMPWFAFRRLKI